MEESYLDMLIKLQESVETDYCMPEETKEQVNALLKKLHHILWAYSY